MIAFGTSFISRIRASSKKVSAFYIGSKLIFKNDTHGGKWTCDYRQGGSYGDITFTWKPSSIPMPHQPASFEYWVASISIPITSITWDPAYVFLYYDGLKWKMDFYKRFPDLMFLKEKDFTPSEGGADARSLPAVKIDFYQPLTLSNIKFHVKA